MSQIIEQRIGTLLGNFGLLPFFALAAGTWVPMAPMPARLVELAFVAYAAVILSFLGAVHWGLAFATPSLGKTAIWNSLGWGVLPSLLGWLALLMAMAGVPTWIVCAFLLADFLLCRLMDARLLPTYPATPAWYPPLRTRLTLLVCIAVLAVLISSL